MNLRDAYQVWTSLMPTSTIMGAETRTVKKKNGTTLISMVKAHYNGACCIDSHFGEELGRKFPLPDDKVCPRELAWRQYIRIRDNVKT